MTNTCFWCGGSAEERAARHEGPHLTWCPRFRESQRGGAHSKIDHGNGMGGPVGTDEVNVVARDALKQLDLRPK